MPSHLPNPKALTTHTHTQSADLRGLAGATLKCLESSRRCFCDPLAHLTASLAHHQQVHLAVDIPAWCSIILSARLGLGLQGCYPQDAKLRFVPGAVLGCVQALDIGFIHSFILHLFLYPFIYKHSPTPQTCSGKLVSWEGEMLSLSVILSSGAWGTGGSLSDLY